MKRSKVKRGRRFKKSRDKLELMVIRRRMDKLLGDIKGSGITIHVSDPQGLLKKKK